MSLISLNPVSPVLCLYYYLLFVVCCFVHRPDPRNKSLKCANRFGSLATRSSWRFWGKSAGLKSRRTTSSDHHELNAILLSMARFNKAINNIQDASLERITSLWYVLWNGKTKLCRYEFTNYSYCRTPTFILKEQHGPLLLHNRIVFRSHKSNTFE